MDYLIIRMKVINQLNLIFDSYQKNMFNFILGYNKDFHDLLNNNFKLINNINDEFKKYIKDGNDQKLTAVLLTLIYNKFKSIIDICNLFKDKIFDSKLIGDFLKEQKSSSTVSQITEMKKDFEHIYKLIVSNYNDDKSFFINKLLETLESYEPIERCKLLLDLVKKDISNGYLVAKIFNEYILNYYSNNNDLTNKSDNINLANNNELSIYYEYINIIKTYVLTGKNDINIFPEYDFSELIPYTEYLTERTIFNYNSPIFGENHGYKTFEDIPHFIIPSYIENCSVVEYNINSIINEDYIKRNKLEIVENSGLNQRVLRKFSTIKIITDKCDNFEVISNVNKFKLKNDENKIYCLQKTNTCTCDCTERSLPVYRLLVTKKTYVNQSSETNSPTNNTICINDILMKDKLNDNYNNLLNNEITSHIGDIIENNRLCELHESEINNRLRFDKYESDLLKYIKEYKEKHNTHYVMDAMYNVFEKELQLDNSNQNNNTDILSSIWQFNKIEQNIKKEVGLYRNDFDLLIRNKKLLYLINIFDIGFFNKF